jgi:hypothetical protein
MKNGLQKKINVDGFAFGHPVKLIEVSEVVLQFDNQQSAADFLGINGRLIGVYVRAKTKIIKSKKDGKTYLIKKDKIA